DIYVTNEGGGTISHFTSAGAYVGTFSSGFTNPVGIVFDSSGDAYIADKGTFAIYKVTEAGVKSTLINNIFFLSGIAIDAANNLYISNGAGFLGGNAVYKYNTTGTLLSTLSNTVTTNPTGVAVDA